MPSEQEKRRTAQQNKALHKWLTMLAEQLNDAGLDMKALLKPEVDIPWTQESAKNHLWRPIQEIMLDKESTAEATTKDYTVIREVIERHLAAKHGIQCPPWPDRFTQAEEQQDG